MNRKYLFNEEELSILGYGKAEELKHNGIKKDCGLPPKITVAVVNQYNDYMKLYNNETLNGTDYGMIQTILDIGDKLLDYWREYAETA